MKGVQHFTQSGKPYNGPSHTMPDGSLHSGKTHSKSSVRLYHKAELPKNSTDRNTYT